MRDTWPEEAAPSLANHGGLARGEGFPLQSGSVTKKATYVVRDLSVEAGVDRESVRRWIRSGRLAATKASDKVGYVIDSADAVRIIREERARYDAGRKPGRKGNAPASPQ